MKILITTDVYTPFINGVVTSVLNLKKGLENLGHEVRILTLSQDSHSKTIDGVYYISSFSAGIVYPGMRVRLKMPGKMYKEIVAWHPAVVHSNCELSTFRYAKKISLACHAPLIHTYHTSYEDYLHYLSSFNGVVRFLIPLLFRTTLRKVDRIIVPSQKAKNILLRYGINAPIRIIPTGINNDKYTQEPSRQWIDGRKLELGLDNNSLIFLYVGRLGKEKNISELLDLMTNCTNLPVQLLIVGDGPFKKELIKICYKLNISSKVSFAGMVNHNDIWKYYHLGDIFVNASNSELQGLTNLEAIASGLPLLCKKDDCLDGVIINGVNGWQYQNSDDFLLYTNLLLNNKGLRRKMSQIAGQFSQQFSAKQFVMSVLSYYSNTTV